MPERKKGFLVAVFLANNTDHPFTNSPVLEGLVRDGVFEGAVSAWKAWLPPF